MLVTVFSDASYCDQTSMAGWGAFVISNRGRLRTGGSFKNAVPNSAIAETYAGLNAIYTALRQGLAKPGDNILLQSDCMALKHYLFKPCESAENHEMRYREERLAIRHSFNKLQFDYALDIELRWVKGHKGNASPRNYCNTVCDSIAKEHMQRARQQAQRQGQSLRTADATSG